MRRTTAQERHTRRRGAAVVEFAIIAPVFLILVLGTIEAGQALRISNLMAAAVREGGRLAAMDWEEVVPDGQTANQKVMDDIRNFLVASGLPGDDIELSITSAEGADEGQNFDLADPDNQYRLFRIDASIPYDSVATFPSTFMGGQEITASLVFRSGRVSLIN